MCTLARPVRTPAMALRKSSTALSMRVFSCVYVSLSPAIAAMVACAIFSTPHHCTIKTLHYTAETKLDHGFYTPQHGSENARNPCESVKSVADLPRLR